MSLMDFEEIVKLMEAERKDDAVSIGETGFLDSADPIPDDSYWGEDKYGRKFITLPVIEGCLVVYQRYKKKNQEKSEDDFCAAEIGNASKQIILIPFHPSGVVDMKTLKNQIRTARFMYTLMQASVDLGRKEEGVT